MDKYRSDEEKYIKDNFDLNNIIEFQSNHVVEVYLGADYNYHCTINKQYIINSISFLGALVSGITKYKTIEDNNREI